VKKAGSIALTMILVAFAAAVWYIYFAVGRAQRRAVYNVRQPGDPYPR